MPSKSTMMERLARHVSTLFVFVIDFRNLRSIRDPKPQQRSTEACQRFLHPRRFCSTLVPDSCRPRRPGHFTAHSSWIKVGRPSPSTRPTQPPCRVRSTSRTCIFSSHRHPTRPMRQLLIYIRATCHNTDS